MFSLFELAKVVEFSKNGGQNKDKGKARVINHAWKDVGKRTALAVNFSNGYLVLCHSVNLQKPVIRQLFWFPDRPILSMCYDQTGAWLMCCVWDAIIIIPTLSMLEPTAVFEKIWRSDDTTEVKLPKLKGQITSCCWWHTHKDEPVALLTTDAGVLYLVNMLTEKLGRYIPFSEHLSQVSVVRDLTQTTSYALVTSKSNKQWRVLLEHRKEQPRTAYNTSGLFWSNKIVPAGSRFSTVYTYSSVLHRADEFPQEEFQPQCLSRFQSEVLVSVQHAKGRDMVGAHNIHTHIYEVYESDMDHSPLYLYHLPHVTNDVLLTDKLLFLTSVDNGHMLSVAANQLAESSGQEGRHQSVIQTFTLPDQEDILSVHKHALPADWFSLGRISLPAEDADSGAPWLGSVRAHTVLDGCMVLTNHTVYICRPRVSPEVLFLRLVLESSDLVQAERLAYLLNLDLNLLYKLAADWMMVQDRAQCSLAVEILQRARCSNLELFELLIKNGLVSAAMPFMTRLISSKATNELTAEQRLLVSTAAVTCYVHEIVTAEGPTEQLQAEFRNFLFTNYHLKKHDVLRVLLQYGLNTLFVEFAQERDIVVAAIKLLLDTGANKRTSGDGEQPSTMSATGERLEGYQVDIPFTLDDSIMKKGRTDLLLQMLDVPELLHILQDDPHYACRLSHVLQGIIPQLPEASLVKLAAILDLSDPKWCKWQNLALSSSAPDSSDDEHSEIDDGEKTENEDKAVESLVNIFLLTLIYLNHRRAPTCLTLDVCSQETQAEPPVQIPSSAPESFVIRDRLQSRPAVVCCGENFTGLVRNADLYTWGCTQDGRLGQGTLDIEVACTPHIVKSFIEYGNTVKSIACGGGHCIAVTTKGLYGWGSSKYGQVGAGASRCTYQSPVYITPPGDAPVYMSSVSCGMYHTVGVSEDFRVYTWGWGVHGQLGHGDAEDAVRPSCVRALTGVQCVMVAAGYAHSVVLSKQGDVYTFGCCNFGQLGNGRTKKSSLPQKLHRGIPEPIIMIDTKYFHTIALGQSGSLYTWGASPLRLRQEMILLKKARQQRGRLGLVENRHLAPHAIQAESVKGNVVKMCCGLSFCAVLTDFGEVYCWGANNDGQLGSGTKIAEGKPYLVSRLNDARMITIATGPNFVVAVDTTGDVYSWGNNDHGQLGTRPRFPTPPPGSSVTSAALLRPYQRPLAGSMGDTLAGNTVSEPQRVDRAALSRVRNLRRYKEELATAAVREHWWVEQSLSSDPSRPSCPDQPAALPSFRSGPAGAPYCGLPYPPGSVRAVLGRLGARWVDTERVMEICDRELGDWGLAATVAGHLGKHGLAFKYQLKHLEALRDSLSRDDYEQKVTSILEQHLSLCAERRADSPVSCDQFYITLRHVLHVWTAESFQIAALQQLVLDHIEVLALPLMLNLVISDPTSTDVETLGEFTLEDLSFSPTALKKELSSEFLLTVIKVATGQVKKGAVKSTFLDKHIQTLFPEVSKLKTDAKSVDKTKLWQEISQYLPKKNNLQSVIHISKEQLHQVMSKNVQSEDSSVLVFFTCSHHCKKSVLDEVLVPELESRLLGHNPPLTQTATKLAAQYSTGGTLAMGCPRCVYAGIAQIM